MSRLVIKFPTRNRPEKFKSVFTRYMTFLSGRHDVRFVVSMDTDDATMNNDAMREWFETRKRNADIKYCYGHSKSKIQACNADMEGEYGDVLLLASDDMNPQQMSYDEVVFKCFEQAFPDFSGAIKFWDGLRPKEDPLMTLTVMGFPLYKQFGYIYNPEYKSVYCDNEQTEVCHRLGKLAIAPYCIIRHEWTNEPFDTLHARNENKDMYDVDSKTFEARKAKNFDMEVMFNASASR
jgi:hypothetical protein